MKLCLRGTLLLACAAMLSLSPAASAASTMDDLSWFGNTGATKAPVKSDEYSGYWWWPTEPASNSSDSELWGNRGVVYNMFAPPSPPPPPPAPTPPAAPPKVERSVPIFNSVLFDFDKAIVKPEGVAEIKKVAAELSAHAGDKITVEGHTCDLNRSGDPAYNQKLGQRRADAVAKVLKDNGIGADRITSASRAESSPAVPNTSDDNRAKNRRVVFKFDIGN